jgi:hypothetical protein
MEEQVLDHPHQGKLEEIFEKSQNYTKLTFEITKLKGLNTTANVVTMLVARLASILFMVLFMLVLSLGAAIWIGDALGKIYYGFFIIAGAYLVVGILLRVFLQDLIKKPISDLIITNALQ